VTEEEHKLSEAELVNAVLAGLERYEEQCRAEWDAASLWTKAEWFWNDLPWYARIVYSLALLVGFGALALLGAWAVAG
jgi:hypothetical protein